MTTNGRKKTKEHALKPKYAKNPIELGTENKQNIKPKQGNMPGDVILFVFIDANVMVDKNIKTKKIVTLPTSFSTLFLISSNND
jgi:hypothetical protein